MIKETKKQKSERLKRTVIIGHRKRKGLCIRCGFDIHDNDNCVENYLKADNRINPGKTDNKIDFDRKIRTIISYREKKILCIRCGLEKHEGSCNEIYNQVDNRPDRDKLVRPAIIYTPKKEKSRIIEEIIETNQQPDDPIFDLKKENNITLQRNFIIVNLSKSDNGNIVEYSFLNHISKKFQHLIICVFGSLEKTFPYSDLIKIRKMINITEVLDIDKQTMIDYLWACDKYYSFKNEYTKYCNKNNIPVYEFPEDKNVTNFLNDTAYHI